MEGMCPDMQYCTEGNCEACSCGTRVCGSVCDEVCGDMDGACPMDQLCDDLTGQCSATPDATCNNTCTSSGDGECDDGRAGSHYSLCELGSDCADCGPVPAS